MIRKSRHPFVVDHDDFDNVGGSGGPPCSRPLLLFYVLALSLALTVLVAAPASAMQGHPFTGTFGNLAQPGFAGTAGVAVDQSTGDVLVMDVDPETGAGSISRFNPDGTPANFPALGSNVIDGQGSGDETEPKPSGGLSFGGTGEAQIAVDNSGGATDGDIYVTQGPGNLINIFSEDGSYLGQLTAAGATPFSEACGVAVDPSGAVYVGDYSGGIHKFVPGANPPVDADYTTTFSSVNTPCALAAGAGPTDGSLFATQYSGAVAKLDSATGAIEGAPEYISGYVLTVTVDPGSGHLLVVAGPTPEPIVSKEVSEYDASGSVAALVASVKPGGEVQGAAADGNRDSIYLTQSTHLDVFGPLGTIPDVVTSAGASSATKSTATVGGTVNPDGLILKASEGCYVEYGLTESYGQNAPCAESAAEIGAGSAAVPVHAEVTGLAPLATYHFRLVAANVNGRTRGFDETFTAGLPDPPVANTGGTGAGGADYLLTFAGSVNPNGFAVDECRFVYGPTTEYGQSTPCDQSPANLGSGAVDKPVTATSEPLDPGTTYHYRLIASNPGGSGRGEDRTFTTGPAPPDACPNASIRAEQGIGSILLPDCMALEQVSPAKKGNQLARQPSRVSADGRRLVFNSFATLDDSPNFEGLVGNLFVASRGASGWTSEGSSPPITAQVGAGRPPSSFSSDLSGWFQTLDTPEGKRLFQLGLGRSLTPFSPALVIQNALVDPSVRILPEVQGASADQTHVYFKPSANDVAYRSGDPQPHGPGADPHVYVAHLGPGGQPVLELLARDRDGKVWGAACGARLGGIQPLIPGNNLKNGNRNQGAISADGSRVYFSTRPDQPAAGECTEAVKKRIMVRVETPTGPEISELIASECHVACSAVDGDDAYQGASLDQTKVYFTTNRQLTDADLDGTAASCDVQFAAAGCDLYLYDSTKPVGQRLTQVSTGDQEGRVFNAIAAISADGSRVYFVAESVLTTDPSPKGVVAVAGQPNFYTWDAGTGKTDFIGTLDASDGGEHGLWGSEGGTWGTDAYPVPIEGTDAAGQEVGGDGHILVFRSRAPLSADDSDGGFSDFFRYEADAGTLERVSKGVSGGSDNGPFGADRSFTDTTAAGTDYAERNRSVSEDGETIEFTTSEGLLPGDFNGVEDVYLWRKGRVYRLPGSAQTPNTPTNQPSLSADGSTVAYHTTQQLLPSDGDTALDVYVARVNGGYPPPPPSPDCKGESCQSSSPPPPGDQGAASQPVTAGNPPRLRCKKGFVLKHGKCRKKHHKQKAHKKAHKRRASVNRRAGK